jgi:hypothetical protein
MIFSLEALRARHGDSLLLHFGTPAKPSAVLIDGGPGAVYGDALKPRLVAMRDGLRGLGRIGADDPLPLELMMVSHIDDDHIGGLLGLTSELIDDQSLNRAPWVAPRTLWHNAFEDLADDEDGTASLAADPPRSEAAAVIASVKQGKRLKSDAELLHWKVNAEFKDAATHGLVEAPEHGGRKVDLDDDTSMLVIAPREDQIEGLRKEWAKQVKRMNKGEASPAELAEYLDKSPYNLSSIVCLARQGKRSMLLTGDARGDHILEALEAADATDAGKLHVDVLKLPHHGSIRNVERDFFKRITADHYVISASGRDGNPESETLELIASARDAGEQFSIHLTYGQGVGDLGDRVSAFQHKHEQDDFTVAIRPDADLSLRIDLGDAPPV